MRVPHAALAAVAAALPLAVLPATGTPQRSGAEVVRYQCVLCHASGVGGAPRIGDRPAWERRARGGLDALFRSVANGRGAMPPRGGLSDLTDDELKAAIRHMLELSNAPEP
jgi:cytochrome c5